MSIYSLIRNLEGTHIILKFLIYENLKQISNNLNLKNMKSISLDVNVSEKK